MYIGQNDSDNDKSDEQLMIAYQKGDFEAFGMLYLRYEGHLYNFFLKWTGDREQADDLLQAVFLKLHRRRDLYNPDYSFAPWFFSIARNTLKNSYHKNRRYNEIFIRQLVLEENEQRERGPTNLDGNDNPEEIICKKERKKMIESALLKLPKSQREAILLNKYGGFSYLEIANITVSSVGSVKQKIHRGYTTLRKLLEGWI
ncbi:MAG: DNA-directed RNA polymerase sigma-70 factor [bacterium]|nr:MAG: DNA-directed RNA polymerase sigma-70 factor [bacterium]